MRAAPRQPQRPAPCKAFNPRTTSADAATSHRYMPRGTIAGTLQGAAALTCCF